MTTEERVFALPDEADNQRFWFLDLIHSPRPLPPLAASLNADVGDASPMGLETRTVHGYIYYSPRTMGPPPEPPPLAPGEALENWQNVYLPATRAAYERFANVDYSGMSGPEALALLDREFPGAAKAFGNTIVSAMEVGPEAERLSLLLEDRLGDPEGTLLAATILHGGGSHTRDIGTEVAGLAAAARATPGVAGALTRHELDAVAADRRDPWASALGEFLAGHADEVALWTEVHIPPWNEDPTSLFRLVAATLAAPQADRTDASAAAVAEARRRLDAADHAEFEAALATSRNYVPVIEHRARWQLKLVGGMRRPAMAIGRALVASGQADAADDVFFLHRAELATALAGQLDVRTLVRERRAAHEEYLRLSPPMMLGLPVPFEMLGGFSPILRRMFGAVAIAPDTETVINGIGGSKGVVRGRARIVGGLDEAEDLADGDILVCPSTSPPWTPYFAIVSAIVTDAGGVLSHAAIEAREYGIPAVVGTRTGTRSIPEGAMVVVDGSAGTVTIER